MESPELSAELSPTEKTNSNVEVFYTGDGHWFSNDWNTLGAHCTPKKPNSTTVVRQRRVNIYNRDPIEYRDRQIIKTGDFRLVQNFLPWFFPWIITMLTYILVSDPKREASERQPQQKQKNETNRTRSRSPVRSTRVVRNGKGTATIPKTRESTLQLVSKSERNYQQIKNSPRERSIAASRCIASSPRQRLSSTCVSPTQQRLIMTPPSSPRNHVTSFDRSSSPSHRFSKKEPQLLLSKQGRLDSDLLLQIDRKGNNIQIKPKEIRVKEQPKCLSVEMENSASSPNVKKEEAAPQPEGLLSLHFAKAPCIDHQISSISEERALSENRHDFIQREESLVEEEESRLARSCSGNLAESMASKASVSSTLERSSKSLPKMNAKARAISLLQAKKAEARRLAKSAEGRGLSGPNQTEDIQGSIGYPDSSSFERRIAIPERDQTTRSGSNGTADGSSEYSHDSGSFNCSRRLDSQNSVDSVSSIGFGLERSMSTQTSQLILRNQRQLKRSTTCSSADTSLSRHPSTISERDSLAPEESTSDSFSYQNKEEEGELQESVSDDSGDEATPVSAFVEFTDTAPKAVEKLKVVSPFAAETYQTRDVLKKHKTSKPKRQTDSKIVEVNNEQKEVQKNKVEPRRTIKRPPPPPIKAKLESSIKSEATPKSKPPPPPAKGKGPAPPPPPPMSKRKNGKGGSGIIRAPAVIAMFQAVSKASKDKPKSKHKKRSSRGDSSENARLASEGSGGDALIKELEKNSRHFLQIQNDVKTYGPRIEQIIQDMAKNKFSSMVELNEYVKQVDSLLEKFADETAVLKHFNWPTSYYVYREALALWIEIQGRSDKCRNWVQGSRGMSTELARMKKYMELNIRRLDDVQRTLDNEVKKFKANGVPWDSSIIPRLHEGTMLLLERYMQIVYDEVSRTHTKSSHRENNVQYLTDTIKLAFKIHQFVGGFTESCTSLFEKIASFTRTLNTDL